MSSRHSQGARFGANTRSRASTLLRCPLKPEHKCTYPIYQKRAERVQACSDAEVDYNVRPNSTHYLCSFRLRLIMTLVGTRFTVGKANARRLLHQPALAERAIRQPKVVRQADDQKIQDTENGEAPRSVQPIYIILKQLVIHEAQLICH